METLNYSIDTKYNAVKHVVQNICTIKSLNPNQPGLFWRLSSRGGGGCSSPPSDLGRGSAKICIKVECNVIYKTVLLDYSLLLSFILYEFIMLIYAKKLIFTINH